MPSATEVVRKWGETLSKVAAGEEVEVTQHGRKVAVVKKVPVPMDASRFLELCEKHKTSEAAAEAMEAAVGEYRAQRSSICQPDENPDA